MDGTLRLGLGRPRLRVGRPRIEPEVDSVASESIRWIQGDYVAFGRCVQVEYLGGLEALNASFAVFGIGVAHAFDMVVRFVRKGDVSVRVGLFLERVDRDNR